MQASGMDDETCAEKPLREEFARMRYATAKYSKIEEALHRMENS